MALRTQYTDKDIAHFIVDSPEKAYTLGFLWGDAHIKSFKLTDGSRSNVHYVALEIVRKDLDRIKDVFNVWGTWRLLYRHRAGRQEQGMIRLFDGSFGWFLGQNDYWIKSSSEPTKILSKIPEAYKHYWWRGFIDADGCFYAHGRATQFSIAGSYGLTWSETVHLFADLGITKYQIQQRVHKKSKSSAIRLSNRDDVVWLGEYLFDGDSTIGLPRKRDKFLLIKSKHDPPRNEEHIFI